ncbi:MAG: flagellar basal body rod C-terminal domain-containing protein, partial [Candidatus Margulisiibacteriota bacterium]
EESNVSALSAMVEMINLMDVMRQYETQQKMIQYQDDATERMITQLTQG